jgi:hypothetical protein
MSHISISWVKIRLHTQNQLPWLQLIFLEPRLETKPAHRTAASQPSQPSQPTHPKNAIGNPSPTNASKKTPDKVRSSANHISYETSTPKRKFNLTEIENENVVPAKIPRIEGKPKFITNSFIKLNGRLQMMKTFDFGTKISTRKRREDSDFTTKIKRKKL